MASNKSSDPFIISPSGNYKLTITYPEQFRSEGTIHNIQTGEVVRKIKRNYPQFNFSWLTKNNQEYLQSGTNIYSQTIVNLATREKFETIGYYLSFCWEKCWISPDGCTLVVYGYHCEHPDKYAFYDFTDPKNGLKKLQQDKTYSCSCIKDPDWSSDGTINMYVTDEYINTGDKLISRNKVYVRRTRTIVYCEKNYPSQKIWQFD